MIGCHGWCTIDGVTSLFGAALNKVNLYKVLTFFFGKLLCSSLIYILKDLDSRSHLLYIVYDLTRRMTGKTIQALYFIFEFC